MEGKVTLYDSNETKIGETFARRARQLVKQQRAFWLDDAQTAVRFLPGMEHLKDEQGDGFAPAEKDPPEDKRLMKLAKTRVVLKNTYKGIYTVYFVVNAFLVALWFVLGRGYFWPGWSIVFWGLAVILVGIIFKLVTTLPTDYNEQVMDEYNKLRRLTGKND
jgi:hypothetical protein